MNDRLAVFSTLERSWAIVRDWAAQAGYEIAILVTVPGTTSAPDLRDPAFAERGTLIMAVPTVAACGAALADLDVDLAVVYSFARVPESIASLPRRGTVNLHPSLLPAYRGPNGFRALYAGEPRLGATLHYVRPELDAGPILAQASYPTPADVQPASILDSLRGAAWEALDTGVPRALAAELGENQDPSRASGAPAFREDEAMLDLTVSAHLFQCRATALMLAGVQPWVVVDHERRPLRATRRLPGLSAQRPGVVHLGSRRAIVATADGALELELGELPFGP